MMKGREGGGSLGVGVSQEVHVDLRCDSEFFS